MCNYSQLKKNKKKNVQPYQGDNGTPYVPQLYASSGKNISNVLKVEA